MARSTIRPRAGSTLLELFIVLAISALLASLLMSAIGQVKTAAKTVRCGSHLRQLLLAITAYGQEQRGFLVSYWVANRYWYDNISVYLDAGTVAGTLDAKGRNVFYNCPEWNWTGLPHYSNMGYGMCHDNNVGTANPFWSNWAWIATGNIRDGHMIELTSPAARIMLGESGGTYIQAVGSVWAGWTANGYDQRKWQGSPPAAANPVRHAGRANYGFVDGHVQSLGPLTSPWGYTDPRKLAL